MSRERYLDWLLESTPTTLLRWLGNDQLCRELGADFEETMAQRMLSTARAEAYARCCPVAGASPADYRLRELSVFSDATVLAGIHFRNLFVDRPFVGVYAQSRTLSLAEVGEASRQLGLEFASFSPKSVSWWSPEQHDLRGAPGAFSDKRLVAGHLDELALSPVALPSEFSCTRDGTGSSYASYAQVLEDSLRRNPEWREDTSKTDPVAYADCARAGLVLELRAGQQTLGIVAARLGALRGVSGWEMVEEILAHELRGRGLAPPLQRLFLASLDRSRAALVWGTIAARNEPSLRTALRVGRRDVGGWVFVPTRQ